MALVKSLNVYVYVYVLRAHDRCVHISLLLILEVKQLFRIYTHL